MVDIRRCYEILDVPIEASIEDINRQHKDLANIWHPDRFAGNLRLQKKAEQKLAEINSAYDTLIIFKQAGRPDLYTNDQTSKKQQIEIPGRPTFTGAPSEGEQSYMANKQWAEAKPKRSLRWIFFCIFIVALLASPLFVIPQMKKRYPFFDDPAGYIKQAVKSTVYEIVEETSKANSIDIKIPADSSQDNIKPKPKVDKRIEIYLDNGSVIRAISYRMENDMIVYQLDHGWVGIQKSKVQSIKVKK
ncbi:MAG: J domain-containing protein [Desulfobacterales bacterium]|nr:J domain-containing protein [Desulfobacterales bacterium]